MAAPSLLPPPAAAAAPPGPAGAGAPPPAATATPLPPATAAAVQQAIAQAPGQSGTIAVSAEPAPPKAIVAAAAEKKKSVLVWHLARPVEWRGEKFKLKIEIPLPKPLNEMTEQEKQDFKHAAEQFADLFVQDMLKELENLKSTEAEVIRIFFDEKNGYSLSTDEKYNPLDPESAKDKDVVFAKGETSKALSAAITNEKRTADAMREALKAPTLAHLHKTAQKQNAEKSKTLPPAGLEWDRNSCFIHAPFQQLVNEPTIANDLANPNYYINGENSPLFRAVKKYREHQVTKEPFDAASILRELLDNSGEFQDALEHGWQAFKNFFDFNNIPADSHLRSLFLNPICIQVGNENDPPGLNMLAEAELGNNDPPAVFSLQIQDRLVQSEEADQLPLSDRVSEEEYTAFLTDIAQKLKPQIEQLSDGVLTGLGIPLPPYGEDFTTDTLSEYLDRFGADNDIKKKFCERITFETIKAEIDNKDEYDDNPAQYITSALADNDKIEALGNIALKLLDNEATLQAAFGLLTAKKKEAINAHRAKRLEYNDNPVKIADAGQLTIKGKEYDIASFTCHTLGRDHFITYVRKGDTCYKLDDLSKTKKIEEISLKDFVTAAKTAYFYTIRDKSLTPKAGSTDPAHPKKETEPVVKPNTPIGEPIRTEGSPVDIVIETGSMKSAGDKFALVNPSDSGLHYLHPQLVDEVIDQDQFESTVKTNTEKDRQWHDWFTNPHTARGQGYSPSRRFFRTAHRLVSSGPRPLITRQKKQKIIHVPLPSLTDDKDVAQAINDVLDFAKSQGITRVAFPVFDYTRGPRSEDIVDVMTKAIQEYLKTHDWREGSHIKIIQPRPQSREAAGAA